MTPTTTRTAVLLGREQLEIREYPLPEIGDHDALLRVEAAGVCGSDVGAYYGVTADMQLPCALGHEVVGRIDRIGKRAAARWGVAEGDRVVVEEYLPCGTCSSCLAGAYQMCAELRYGSRAIDTPPHIWGGYGDVMYLHPQSLVHAVSDALAPKLAQLYIPLSNGLHWTGGIGGAGVGSCVVVIGPGPHGLACVIGAKEAGASVVVLVGQPHDGARLELGLRLGADITVDGGEPAEIEAVVRDANGGAGADAVVNLAGATGLGTALAAAGDRATIVQVGPGPGRVPDDLPWRLIEKLLTLRGVRGRPSRAVASALRLIESGRYPLELMVNATYGVDETERALIAVREDPGIIRAVISPTANVPAHDMAGG